MKAANTGWISNW